MQNYRKVVGIFKRKFPEYRVNVRRVRMPHGLHGDCSRKSGNHFLIRIKSELPEDVAIDTFLHEFAHILSWHKPGDDHGIDWGVAYSKVYRIFLREYIDN